MLPPCPAAGLAVVRVAHDLCQRGVAARPVRRRPALADGGLPRHGRTVVRLPRPTYDRRRTSSGRSETRAGIPAGRKRRNTINSPWKRSRWPKRRWPRSDLLGETRRYLAIFRRAHGWFHGAQQPELAAGGRSPRHVLRRPAGRSGVNRNQGAESTLAYLWTEMSQPGMPAIAIGENPRAASAASA